MNGESEAARPPCPTCRGPLVSVGSREIGSGGLDFRRQHAYWCPAGCPGPESDGTFEFIECPECGSHETSSRPRDGVEEVQCDGCGTITTIQLLPTNP